MASDAAVIVLAILVGLLAIPHAVRVSSFIWLYFLRPSTVKNYLHGDAPYALITGATDGIGKATSAEFLRKGFNLIIHGRNEDKMLKVIKELRARVPEKSSADIRYFIADASLITHDFAKLIEPFKDLHITVVLHNVGGSDLAPERLDARSQEYILGVLNKNALFSLFLQRALLPQLRRVAASGPVLVQFTGSIASDIAPPRLPIYAASKGLLQSLVRGLDNDELYFDVPTGVRYTYLSVGSVHSDNHDVPMKPSLRTPTSDAFGRYMVARVGCGMRRVSPYWFHSALTWMLDVMGDATVDKFSAAEMEVSIAEAQKGR